MYVDLKKEVLRYRGLRIYRSKYLEVYLSIYRSKYLEVYLSI
jgi:hypothetical protein